MKKISILIILLVCIISICGCKKNQNNEPQPSGIVNLNIKDIEMEIDSTYIIDVETDSTYSLRVNNEEYLNASIKDNDITKIYIESKKIGSTTVDVIFEDKVVNTINVTITDKVIFIPVPTGSLLLKGINKEASVKVVLTKDNLNSSDVVWEMENEGIVTIQTQGCIAHFVSVTRGVTKVTVRVGNYTNSFNIYVTNIRGDLE